MDEDTLIGIQKMREDNKWHRFTIEKECEAYKKALEDITNADTAGQMLTIAYRVLEENRK
jgi:dsDNA-binding SOS-regulon protein